MGVPPVPTRGCVDHHVIKNATHSGFDPLELTHIFESDRTSVSLSEWRWGYPHETSPGRKSPRIRAFQDQTCHASKSERTTPNSVEMRAYLILSILGKKTSFFPRCVSRGRRDFKSYAFGADIISQAPKAQVEKSTYFGKST